MQCYIDIYCQSVFLFEQSKFINVHSMKILQLIGVSFFFLHYYLFISLTFLKNILIYIWKRVTKSSTEKHIINPYQNTHPYVYADINQIIQHEGFLMNQYRFQTKDGAQVLLWRVKKQDCNIIKPYPVLIMHGLLDCAASWFLHSNKSKSLPYILAEQGYDVWVGNNRGNRLSRDEEDDCSQYWSYNFDHLVQYDQPAAINGILNQTGKQKIIYIGHSQGSTQFLFGLGIHNHLKNRIAAFIGLGTVVSLTNVKSHLILNILSKCYLLQFYKMIGFQKILVLPKYLSKAVGVLLYNSTFHISIIMNFIRLLCGYNNANKIPSELFGVIITHEPGGSSVNNAIQWVQCYRQGGEMRKFDYGSEKNIQLYGNAVPPSYGLEHLDDLPFNSYLFRGSKDTVISDKDFNNLVRSFDKQKIQIFELDDYNHLDYVWSNSAENDLYKTVLSIIEENSSC